MPELIAFSLVILLFSVVLHEVMHGVVALRFGDRTAEMAGRLTLNPIPHIDPIGTILVPGLLIIPALLAGTTPGFIIGWAKPVPVNPLNFSDLRKGEFFVSAAGVAANFSLAIIAAIVYHLLRSTDVPMAVLSLLRYTISVNLLLGVFNLFPIPPLDGSKMLLSQLPYNLAKEYEKIERYGPIIILVLLFSGVLSTILSFLIAILSKLLGL